MFCSCENTEEYQLTDVFDPIDTYCQRLTNDFGFFLRELWADRGLDSKAPLSEVELDMAEFAANGPRRRGELAFRGIGKTHVVVGALSVFRLRRDRDRKILIPSKSLAACKETVGLIRSWIDEVWFLRDLQPIKGKSSDTTTYFDAGGAQEHKQPSVKAIGIDGMLEGNRAHTILPDDVETKGNSKTLDARDELKRLVKEFTVILYPDRPHKDGGPVDPVEICYVGTPKHEETLYITLKKQGYEFRSYPIRYPATTEEVISLAPILRRKLDTGKARPGDPVAPHRFGPLEIAEREAEGYSEFAREGMLIANLADTNQYPLRLSDLIVVDSIARDKAPVGIQWGTRDHNGPTHADIPALGLGQDRLYRPVMIDKDYAPFQGTKAGLDPAGRGKDRTGLAIVAQLNGTLWLKRLDGLPGGADPESLDRIASTLREHGAREVILESNIDAFGTYRATLESAITRHSVQPGESDLYPLGWSCSIEDTRAHGQKETRILNALEPVISGHRLVVTRDDLIPPTDEKGEYDRNNCFQYQLTRLSSKPKCLPEDGKIDALAIVVKAWTDTLRVDPKIRAASARVRLMEKAIQDHLAPQFGEPKQPNWIKHRN